MSRRFFGAESQIFFNQKACFSLDQILRCWLISGVMSDQFSVLSNQSGNLVWHVSFQEEIFMFMHLALLVRRDNQLSLYQKAQSTKALLPNKICHNLTQVLCVQIYFPFFNYLHRWDVWVCLWCKLLWRDCRVEWICCGFMVLSCSGICTFHSS